MPAGPETSEAQAAKAQNAGLSSYLKRWLPLVVLVAIMAFGISQGWHKFLSLNALVDQRENLQSYLQSNYALTLGLYGLLYIVVVALSLPGGAAMTIAGGFLFGWFVGGLTAVTAATLGATLVFLIASSSLGSALQARAGPFLNKLSDGFKEDALNYLLFLRLVPIFPFWLINLAPAFLGVSLRAFVIGTFVGIIPGTFAFAFIGSGLDSIIVKQRAESGCAPDAVDCDVELSMSGLITPEIIAAFVALGLVALIPPALKKFRGKRVKSG